MRTVTKWAGELGASNILATLALNGWAARSLEPIEITFTGDEPTICYKPAYAVAFASLVI
jgi:hypothetical protein